MKLDRLVKMIIDGGNIPNKFTVGMGKQIIEGLGLIWA